MFPADFVDKWHKDAEDRRTGRAPPLANNPPPPPTTSSSGPHLASPSNSRTLESQERRIGPSANPQTSLPSNPAMANKLPQHLRVQLSELYVDNLPQRVSIGDLRDHFDDLGSSSPPFLTIDFERCHLFCSRIPSFRGSRWYRSSSSRSWFEGSTLLARFHLAASST